MLEEDESEALCGSGPLMKTVHVLLISIGLSAGIIGCSNSPPAEMALRNWKTVRLASVSEKRANLGRGVLIDGIAFNAKLGAIVEVGEEVVYLKGLEIWPPSIVGQPVRVSGILQLFKGPIARQDQHGRWSAGIGDGLTCQLAEAKWTALERQSGSNRIAVLGYVNKTGLYTVNTNLVCSVEDLIAMAGGLTTWKPGNGPLGEPLAVLDGPGGHLVLKRPQWRVRFAELGVLITDYDVFSIK